MELIFPLNVTKNNIRWENFYCLVKQVYKQVWYVVNKISAYDYNLRYACGRILLPFFRHHNPYVHLNSFHHAYGRMNLFRLRISYLLHDPYILPHAYWHILDG